MPIETTNEQFDVEFKEMQLYQMKIELIEFLDKMKSNGLFHNQWNFAIFNEILICESFLIPFFSIISLFVNSPLNLSLTTAHLTSLEYTFLPIQKHLRCKYILQVYHSEGVLYCLNNLG